MSSLRLINPNEDQADASEKKPKARPGFYQLLLDRVEQFSTMALQVIRDGDPEAIHQTRVYSRRVQSAFEVLPGELNLRVQPLRKQLRRVRNTLNKVRDYDVFLEIVNKRSSTLKNTAPYTLLCDLFISRRQKVIGKMQQRLMDLGVREFPSRFISAITDPDTSLKVDGTSLRVELASVARDDKAFERAVERINEHWHRVEALTADEFTFSDSNRLHALRIALKRLRYIVELVAQMSEIHSRPVISKLKGLQELLGEWHDLEMLEIRVIKIIGDPEFIMKELESSRTLHTLIAQVRRRKVRVVARLKKLMMTDRLQSLIHDMLAELRPVEKVAERIEATLHATASE